MYGRIECFHREVCEYWALPERVSRRRATRVAQGGEAAQGNILAIFRTRIRGGGGGARVEKGRWVWCRIGEENELS